MGFGIWKIPLMSCYACWTFIIILKNNFGSDFLQGVFLCGTKVRRALFTFAKSYRPMLGKYWLKIPSKGFRTPCRWKLDSGLQSLAGLQVRFRIPKSRWGAYIPQEKIFTFWIPWHNLYPESSGNLEVFVVTKAGDLAIFCLQSLPHKSLKQSRKGAT